VIEHVLLGWVFLQAMVSGPEAAKKAKAEAEALAATARHNAFFTRRVKAQLAIAALSPTLAGSALFHKYREVSPAFNRGSRGGLEGV
jgi:hypothetical protein